MLCIAFPISDEVEKKESFAFRVKIKCLAPLNRGKKKTHLDFSLK